MLLDELGGLPDRSQVRILLAGAELRWLMDEPLVLSEPNRNSLETAIRDYEFMSQIDAQPFMSSSQKKRRAAIVEDGDPYEFFAGAWYRDICYFLGLDPDSVTELLQRRSPTTEMAQAS